MTAAIWATGTWTFDDALEAVIPRVHFRQHTTEPKSPAPQEHDWAQELLSALVPFPEARLAVTNLLLKQHPKREPPCHNNSPSL